MLKDLISRTRQFQGLTRKSVLGEIMEIFHQPTYDDAGLLTISGVNVVASVDCILETIVDRNPWQAGYFSILVSVNDVLAKGAKPIAYLDSISSPSSLTRRSIAQGIKYAADNFGLTLLKGHTTPDVSYNAVESTVIGVAKNFIPDNGAQIGDSLIIVMDPNGTLEDTAWLKVYDSTYSKSSQQLLIRQETLLNIADRRLVNSAKDISGAGIIGTIAMLCESTKAGAEIILERIPHPPEVALEDWLLTYPSFGFIYTTKKKDTCLGLLRSAGLEAEAVGSVTSTKQVRVSYGDEKGVFLDLEKEDLYGSTR